MALSSFERTFIPFCRSHPCHHSRTSETPLNNSICVYLILSLSLFSHSLTLTHTTNILVNFPKASLLSYSALFCFPSSLSSLNLQLSLTRVSCFTNNTYFSLSLSLFPSYLSVSSFSLQSVHCLFPHCVYLPSHLHYHFAVSLFVYGRRCQIQKLISYLSHQSSGK